MNPADQPMNGKERTARYRARKDAGDFVTGPVDVSAHAAKKLVEHGLASPEELTDKNACPISFPIF